MALIGKTHLHGDLRRFFPLRQQQACSPQPQPNQISVRRLAESPGELASQAETVQAALKSKFIQAGIIRHVLVQIVPQAIHLN